MMGDRHMLGGVSAWLVAAPLLNVPVGATVAGIPVALFCSLLPDIDHHNAVVGRNPAGWLVQRFTTHRYETHSLFTALAFTSAAYLLWGGAFASAVATGWMVGHIFLDWNTRQGVALFWPFSRELYRAPWARFVKTSGPSEIVMICVLGLALLVFVFWRATS